MLELLHIAEACCHFLLRRNGMLGHPVKYALRNQASKRATRNEFRVVR